ncbi:MAG: hypothetical protein Q8L63_01745 [Alphaproteobacteria bacterium]|nr:hypothetical protein [Alphaproteobacteria bacterium]
MLSPATLEELRSAWTGVVQMRERMKTIIIVTFAGGALTGPALREVVYNLPLLLSFDVLKQALAEAGNEKLFVCSARAPLGKLMDCGRDSLAWIDWENLREGVRRRNAIAHDGQLFDGKQCLQDIDNVEAQLIAWKILSAV